MTKIKIRQYLTLAHLLISAFMAPVLVLLAFSGGLYLLGNKGETVSKQLTLPVDSQLDFKSSSLDANVRKIFDDIGLDYDFQYIKNRGNKIQTRPTNKPFVVFTQTKDGVTAEHHTPNLQFSLMELHKGHGPKAYKNYQKLVALGLFLSVLSGLIMGLLVKTYRRKTWVSLLGGFVFFMLIAYWL